MKKMKNNKLKGLESYKGSKDRIKDVPLDMLPKRIQNYLMEYRENNNEDYLSLYGTAGLRELSLSELTIFFRLATTRDKAKMML